MPSFFRMILGRTLRCRALLAALLTAGLLPALCAAQPSGSEADSTAASRSIDAFWAEAVRTVEAGDFDAYADLYHEDAVYVSSISGTSQPIAAVLPRWKPGFQKTRAGEMTACVAFRLTERIRGDTTAHESGIFQYTEQPAGGKPSTTYVRFEAVLTRTGGAWTWLVEHQIAVVDAAAWNAAEGEADQVGSSCR